MRFKVFDPTPIPQLEDKSIWDITHDQINGGCHKENTKPLGHKSSQHPTYK